MTGDLVVTHYRNGESNLIVIVNLLVTLPVVPLNVKWVNNKDSDFQWPSKHTNVHRTPKNTIVML